MIELIIFLITIFFIIFIVSDKVKYSKKIYILFTIDLLLILSILFRHYLNNRLLFIGILISIYLLIINIFSTITLLMKCKKKKYFANFVIPILSIFLFFSSIPEKISMKIEFSRTKNRLEKILQDESYLAKYNVYKMGNYIYSFYYSRDGILDPWSGITYDSSGILEKVVENFKNDKKFDGLENCDELKEFRGRLRSIEKIENNWFLCRFYH